MTIWDIDLGWFVILALAAAFGGMIIAERLCYTAKKAEAAEKALDKKGMTVKQIDTFFTKHKEADNER